MKYKIKIRWYGVFVALVVYAVLAGVDAHIAKRTDPFIYREVYSLPDYPVALVLGTSPRLRDGTQNAYFIKRMDAAAALYHAGKVKKLILSGDAHIGDTGEYNEPAAMQNALLERGVPVQVLQQDGEGYRTIDSIRRAKTTYAANAVIVVSQHFHNQRALYLAQALNLPAAALDADEVSTWMGLRTQMREKVARIRMLWELRSIP